MSLVQIISLVNSQNDTVSLKFPISDSSEQCSTEDITDVNLIGTAKTNIDSITHYYEEAKGLITSESFYLDGIESLDSIMSREILETLTTLRDTEIDETKKEIEKLEQQQEDKDKTILEAYNKAKEAYDAMVTRNNAKTAMEDAQDKYYEILNSEVNDFQKQNAKTNWDNATNEYNEKNTTYKSLREEAFSLYREAYSMDPKEPGDYDMVEI